MICAICAVVRVFGEGYYFYRFNGKLFSRLSPAVPYGGIKQEQRASILHPLKKSRINKKLGGTVKSNPLITTVIINLENRVHLTLTLACVYISLLIRRAANDKFAFKRIDNSRDSRRKIASHWQSDVIDLPQCLSFFRSLPLSTLAVAMLICARVASSQSVTRRRS